MNSVEKRWQYAAGFSLIAMIVLSLLWELWLSPLREGGSWLALKALPLCLPLAGILKGKIYTFQWASMFVLIYFAEAVMRLFDLSPVSRICAALMVLLSVLFFVACLAYVKNKRKAVS